MSRAMAQSDPTTMKRLDRVENAIGQITKILVEQSERVDSGFRNVHGEIHAVRGEVHAVRGELETMRQALTERLDRLIAVTTQERTS
jgi:hypothetical protein